MMIKASQEYTIRNSMRFPLNNASVSLLIFLVVFLFCLMGILTRPIGFLATFWPANAVMLGLFLRIPEARSWAGWTASFSAFLAADLATGSSFEKAIILNGINLASVAGAFSLFCRLPARIVELQHPASVPFLLLGSMAGSLAGGIGGMFANPYLFGESAGSGLQFWFVTEFANYIAVLPLILSAPNPFCAKAAFHRPSPAQIAPFAALCLSCLASITIGGAGAIVFIVPALLWCGLTYSVFVTAALTATSSYWALAQLVAIYLPDGSQGSASFDLISYRLGVSLVALSPIMQAVTSTGRRSTIDHLKDAANRDSLTQIANRRAFLDRAQAIIGQDAGPSVMLMMDLDHFKRINDSFGHAIGDMVLVECARRVSACLRDCDLFGRLGGEEFAILIPGCSLRQGYLIAERIRRAISSERLTFDHGRSLMVTASIGVAPVDPDRNSVAESLGKADTALYSAKRGGRDRVETFFQMRRNQ